VEDVAEVEVPKVERVLWVVQKPVVLVDSVYVRAVDTVSPINVGYRVTRNVVRNAAP